jgi:hypothetical protein
LTESNSDGAVLFDTTAIGERAFGEPRRQLQIENLISTRKAIVATYVREQYKATFVRSIILCHNRFVDRSRGEPDTPEGLLRATGGVLADLESFTFAKPREAARARKVISSLLKSARTIRSLLNTLERLIEMESETMFVGMASSDATGCCLCDPKPIRDDAGLYALKKSCRANPPRPCSIDEFWSSRKDELVAISRISTKNPHVSQAQRAAHYVINKSAKPRGNNCTVHLSDAVIASESPPSTSVATTDVDDFTELTNAIGANRTVVAV